MGHLGYAWMILGLLKSVALRAERHGIGPPDGDLLVDTFRGRSPSIKATTKASVDCHRRALALLPSHRRPEIRHPLRKSSWMPSARLGLLGPERDAAISVPARLTNFSGPSKALLALYRVNGDPALLEAVLGPLREHPSPPPHPLGGPWGGIGGHKKSSTQKGFFSRKEWSRPAPSPRG